MNWNRIKAHYREFTPAIYRAGRDEWGMDAYAWELAGIVLTPIEFALWHDIRSHNMVLYPQYPVAGYFVDFGNPVARVAIECDGAAFHTDRAKDARRQAAIEANGWTVYRFTGRECWDEAHEGVDEDGNSLWIRSQTSERMAQIAERHGIKRLGSNRGVRHIGDISIDWFEQFAVQSERRGHSRPDA